MSDDKFAPLNSRGLSAKREYVRGLEQRADPEALSLLVECICDESWYLRGLAEEAFLRLGDRGAAVLLPLLEQGLWYTRTSTARVLGRLGYRPAVHGLLRLADDSNTTVANGAREALIAIGHQRGSVTIAHALHRLPPEVRRRRLDELAERDRPLLERVERLMRSDELMSAESGEALCDDDALVRASEDGVEWELLTGPVPPRKSPGESGGGHAGTPGA
jgi:HEAT repeat protein